VRADQLLLYYGQFDRRYVVTEYVGYINFIASIYLTLGMMMLLCGPEQYFLGSETCTVLQVSYLVVGI